MSKNHYEKIRKIVDGSFYSPSVEKDVSNFTDVKTSHILDAIHQLARGALYEISEKLNEGRLRWLKSGMTEHAGVLAGAIKIVEAKAKNLEVDVDLIQSTLDGSRYSPGVCDASPDSDGLKARHLCAYARDVVFKTLYDVSGELNVRRLGWLKAGMSEQAGVLAWTIKLVEGDGRRRSGEGDSDEDLVDEDSEGNERLADVEQNVVQKISKYLHLKDDAEAEEEEEEAPAAPAPDRTCHVVQLCELSAGVLASVEAEEAQDLVSQIETMVRLTKQLPDVVRNHFNTWMDAAKADQGSLFRREYRGFLRVDVPNPNIKHEMVQQLSDKARGLMKDLLEHEGFTIQSSFHVNTNLSQITFSW